MHIIDVRDRSLIANIKVGVSPFALTVSPTTELVYVVMGGNNEVWVIDPDKQAVIRKFPVGELRTASRLRRTGRGFLSRTAGRKTCSVIDAQSMNVGFGCDDGKRVFVVNNASRNVSILPADLRTQKHSQWTAAPPISRSRPIIEPCTS